MQKNILFRIYLTQYDPDWRKKFWQIILDMNERSYFIKHNWTLFVIAIGNGKLFTIPARVPYFIID